MTDSTIVIGAGMAGLSAASQLRAEGKKVTVLEATTRPGGRIVRISHNGDSAEAGAQGIHSGYAEVHKLLKTYNLTDDLVPQTAHQACHLTRDGQHACPAGHLGLLKLMGWRGSLDFCWFAARYMGMMKKFSLYETHRDIPSYDNVTTAEAFAWAGDDFRDFVLKPAAHAMVGTDLEHTNLYHFLNLMKLVSTTTVSTLRSGNSTLAERIADSLDVRYETPVQKLLYEKGRVTGVQAEGGNVIRADHVIVACPIGHAAKIMPSEFVTETEFLSKFPNIPMTIVFFFLDRPLNTNAYVYMGHAHRTTTFNMALNHTIKTPHLVPSGKGIISAWPCYPDAAKLAGMSDSEVIAKASADMEAFFPGIREMTAEIKVQRHSWGLGRLAPGQHNKILSFKRQAEMLRGVSFASNDYDGVHIESAVQSGTRAAARVLASV